MNIYVVYEPSHRRRPSGRPSPTKYRSGLTPSTTSQMMTSCALPKTKPVGGALQSTVLQPTNVDDDNVNSVQKAYSRGIYLLKMTHLELLRSKLDFF